MSRNLYEITSDFLTIQEMLQDDECECIEALHDTLEGVDYEFDEKIVNFAKVIKNIEIQTGSLRGTEKALEDELKLIKAKIKARENKIKYLKNYMLDNMNIVGKQKVKTNEFNIYKSKTVNVRITDLEKAEESVFAKVKKEIDKPSLLKALKEDDNTIDFAVLREKEFIVIK